MNNRQEKTNQEKTNIEAIYPLSPLQQGILYHSILSPESAVYFEQLSCCIEGQFDIDAFEHAWKEILKRHTILRTAFVWKKVEKMLQVVYKDVKLPLEVIDWSDISEDILAEKIEEFLICDRQKGFQLNKAPLPRITIILTGKEKYRLIWSCHHLLLDGWSRSMLLNEAFNLYESFMLKKPAVQMLSSTPYQAYISWLEKQDKKAAEKFWRDKLSGFKVPVSLPKSSECAQSEIKDEDYKCENILLNRELTDRIKSYAREYKITINSILQGAWSLALSRFSSDDDVVFGATVSGRSAAIPGIETMMGLFINTIPIRSKIDLQKPVSQWLKELHRQGAEYREYEYTSLLDIQQWSEIPQNNQLFDTIFVFENFPVSNTGLNSRGNTKISDVKTYSKTNYPITFISAPEDELPLVIWYNEKIYSADLIVRLLAYVKTVLGKIADDKGNKTISSLQVLTDEDIDKLLYRWNNSVEKYPEYPCVHELFEYQAGRNPEAIALSFENNEVTYKQLNEMANRLAGHLIENGVGLEVIVGIIAERSVEMIAALLAVLKAGGAYLPIDPAYPKERIDYIIKDSKINLLLTDTDLSGVYDGNYLKIISFTNNLWEEIKNRDNTDPEVNVKSDNLAYVIYTSGSTGNPKGAMLQHKGLCNLCAVLSRNLYVTSESRLLQFASFSFDSSVAEIFLALTAGAKLYLAKRETLLSQEGLSSMLKNEKIGAIIFPPSMLNNFQCESFPDLKAVVSAGERCPKELAALWSKHHRFINGYGPTEATVGSSLYPVNGDEISQSIPIGKPIDNGFFYVLDKHMNLVPPGITGELYIGGIGLARGYLNKPELTAERFLPNPFIRKEGERLYKSGDLVKYLPDGNLEFVGRTDNQIKLRGFRIELEEIESVLSQYPEVKNTAAVLKENNCGSKSIVVFYDTVDNKEIDSSNLWNFLKSKLPEYMLPSAVMKLDMLPVSPNGKIDKKLLEKNEHQEFRQEETRTRPSTLTEELLEAIWMKLLKVNTISTNNNFFELGGHSLKATQMVSLIREIMNVEVPLREIFSNPTIRLLAQKIDSLKSNETIPEINKRKDNNDLKLSYSQERLWFLDQLVPESNFYNIPAGIKITGKVNIQAVEYSISEIIKRHEILRTFFRNSNGQSVQIVKEEIPFPLSFEDISDHISEGIYGELNHIINEEAGKPFDLTEGPLFRVKLIKLQDDEHILLFVTHHIISDGWSGGIIVKEFSALYESFVNKTKTKLPELKIQYADYAQWQREWLRGEYYEKTLSYWKEKLQGDLPVLDLPIDHPRKAIQTFNGSLEKKVLSAEISNQILALGKKEGATPFMVLLTIFKLLLYKYSGNGDIIIGTPIANRIRKELEELIGFFVNTIVIRTKIRPDNSFLEILKQVREKTIEAYEHQNMPFEKLVEVLQPERNMSHSPIFQAAFVYQNFSSEKVSVNDLKFEPYEVEDRVSKYDISLTVIEQGDRLELNCEYNTDLFESTTIKQMMTYFVRLTERILSKPKEKVSEYSLLPEDEMNIILNSWNNTDDEYPSDSTVVRQFESIANRYPELTALSFSDVEAERVKTGYMSYGNLNERANQLAHFILTKGAGRGRLIGISMTRSFDMIVSILAVLKSGGAFVPIDPVYPFERINYMIQDSGISLLLTEHKLLNNLPEFNSHIICVDSEWDKISCLSKENLMMNIAPEDLAYVIYTSGSTGKPKGTLLHHRGLCNLSSWQKEIFNITQESRILQFASLSFDASVWEIVMALMNEASLSIISKEIVQSIMDHFISVINELEITTITVPPSLLAVIPERNQDQSKTFSSLKTIIVAGEKCPAALANRWSKDYNFFNAYGPTETTVCATANLCCDDYKQSTPIGTPINNFRTYILDQYMNPLPVGTAGELFIGGPGLAYGYLNKADLSAERFVPDPFSKENGQRLYRTGDVARYLAGGKIDFIGRRDNQVKIRGFRIEIEEIRSTIADYSGFKDVIVNTYTDEKANIRIAAYLVNEDNSYPDILQLRAYMKKRLPDYMIPTVFIFVDSIPLTSNGKVDFKALPSPELSAQKNRTKFAEAGSEEEKFLVKVCADLLGIKKVGIYDNFFEIGGHSLLAVQLLSRIKENFKINIPLVKLFDSPTIAELAEIIKNTVNQSLETEEDKIERQTDSDDEIEKMISEIESISDEEAKLLFAREISGNIKRS